MAQALTRSGELITTEYEVEWPVVSSYRAKVASDVPENRVADPEYEVTLISGDPGFAGSGGGGFGAFHIRITVTCPTVGAVPSVAFKGEYPFDLLDYADGEAVWVAQDDPYIIDIESHTSPGVTGEKTTRGEAYFIRYEKDGMLDSKILNE